MSSLSPAHRLIPGWPVPAPCQEMSPKKLHLIEEVTAKEGMTAWFQVEIKACGR